MARIRAGLIPLNIWNTDISVKLLLAVCFTLTIVPTQSAEPTDTDLIPDKIPDLTDLILIKLQKCSNNVSKNNWIVPSWLQAPLSKGKIQFLISIRKHQYQKDQYPNTSTASQIFKFSLDLKENSEFDCTVQNESTTDSSFQKSTLVLNRNNLVESAGPNITLTRDYSNSIYYIMPNGYFRIGLYSIPPDNYCISSITAEEIKIKTCVELPSQLSRDVLQKHKPNTIGNKLVLPKCCSLGQTIHWNLDNLEDLDCLEAIGSQEWSPRIVKKIPGFFRDKNVGVSEPEKHQPYFYHQILGCKKYAALTPNMEIKYPAFISEFRILENGNVTARSDGNSFWGAPKNPDTKIIESFCVDGLVNTGSRGIQAQGNNLGRFQNYDSNDSNNEIYLYCDDDGLDRHANKVYEEMFFYMTLVSSFILLVVVVIYTLIWSSQNIHGWTNASYSLSMLLNFICVGIIHGLRLFDSSSQLIPISSTLCISIGAVGHFFEIATFSWMAILNFDLYTTISSMTPSSGSRLKGKLRFLSYCCFGFGTPILVVSISLVLDTQFGLFDDRVLRPQYGYRNCSIDKSARLHYIVIPIIILFMFNTLFAMLTAKFLYDFKKGTKCLKDSQRSQKTRFKNAKLFFQLFILMGFTWSFEIISSISWLVHGPEPFVYPWWWAIFDSYNFLQAIGLFWIFVCKREVEDQLCSRYQSIDAIFKWIGHKLNQPKSTSGATKSASYVTM